MTNSITFEATCRIISAAIIFAIFWVLVRNYRRPSMDVCLCGAPDEVYPDGEVACEACRYRPVSLDQIDSLLRLSEELENAPRPVMRVSVTPLDVALMEQESDLERLFRSGR